jgi:hypothetical protein
MANLLPCKGHGSGYCCLYKQRHVTPRGSTLPQTSDILHLHEYLGGGGGFLYSVSCLSTPSFWSVQNL